MKTSIFLSGPHGCGKTTLCQRLIADQGWTENDADIDFSTDFTGFAALTDSQRSWLRAYHRIFMVTSAERLARHGQNGVIITNRSVLDSLAYLSVYVDLGLITKAEANKQRQLIANAGPSPHVVIVNPSLAILEARLAQRHTRKERPERDALFAHEDNRDFLERLRKAYESMRNQPNVLYLEDNSPDEQARLLAWVQDA